MHRVQDALEASTSAAVAAAAQLATDAEASGALADELAHMGYGADSSTPGLDWVFQPATSNFKQPARRFKASSRSDANRTDILHGETIIDRKSKVCRAIHYCGAV